MKAKNFTFARLTILVINRLTGSDMKPFTLKIKYSGNDYNLPISDITSRHAISDMDDLDVVCNFLSTFSEETWTVAMLLEGISRGWNPDGSNESIEFIAI